MADGRVLLRAERSVNEDGRVYVITVTATDAAGNSSSASVAVAVNHDETKPAVDSGQHDEVARRPVSGAAFDLASSSDTGVHLYLPAVVQAAE